MKFRIFRDASPGCEPLCAEWIYAEGKFVAGSVEALRQILDRAGRRPLPLLIHSPGGDINAALAMGRLIRARKIDVAVARTIERGPTAEPPRRDAGVARGEASSLGGWCASACSLFLAGAERRFIGPAARVAVHDFKAYDRKVVWVQRFYRDKIWRRGEKIVRREREWLGEQRQAQVLHDDPQNHARIESGIESYLRQMGVTPLMAALMARTPHSSAHVLSRSELIESRLLSDDGGAELLVALYEPFPLAPSVALPAPAAPSAAAAMLWSTREACFLAPQSLKEKCLGFRATAQNRVAAEPRAPFAASRDAKPRVFADWTPPPILAAIPAPVSASAPSPAGWRSLCAGAAKAATPQQREDYLRHLAYEVKTHLPRGPNLGAAIVAVNLLIGPSGEVISLGVRTDRGGEAYEAAMKKSLASIRTPPPPTGCFLARQMVNFH